MSKALEIENLIFSYDNEKTILKGINLSVDEGSFTAIVGDNGAGKSTLMKLLIGELNQTEGFVKIFGDLNTKNNRYMDISYISQNSFEEYRHFPTTIEEVIKIYLRYLKSKKKTDEILKEAGLLEHRKKRLSELSGGLLQRVSLMIALLKDSKIILLDEPGTGVDKHFSDELYKMLKNLSEKGKTVVMITHHLEEAKAYVDAVYKIKDGICEKIK